MWEKAVDSYILALHFVPDCFVTPKMHVHINTDDDGYDDYDDNDDYYEYYNNYSITMLRKLSSWMKDKKYLKTIQ